ncbi:hypothetical protein PCE1_000176 [Barthelona sp. PCE]
MVLVHKGDDGCAYIKKLNTETGENDKIYLDQSEEFLDIYWVSKDETIIATVHSSCICVYQVDIMMPLWTIPISGTVRIGCLSSNGNILAYQEGDEYYSVVLTSTNHISKVNFPQGNRCWVNSNCLFIQKGNQFHKFIHGEKRAALTIEGDVMVQDRDCEMYIIRCSSTAVQIINDASICVNTFSKVQAPTPIKYADISEKYLAFGNASAFQVYDRQSHSVIMNIDGLSNMQSVCISPDEEFIFSIVLNDVYIYKIGSSHSSVAVIPTEFVGSATVFEKLGDGLKLIKNPLNSLFYNHYKQIYYQKDYKVLEVQHGCLLFLSTEAYDMTESRCRTKKYEKDRENSTVSNVSQIYDLYKIEFEDGATVLLEWSHDSGFGRSTVWVNESVIVDENNSIASLYFVLNEKEQQCNKLAHQKEEADALLKEQKLHHANQLSNQREETDILLREQKLHHAKQLANQRKKTDILLREKTLLCEKLTSEKEEMDRKFSIVYNELVKHIPCLDVETYKKLSMHFDDCANEMLQLEVPPDDLFVWLSSNPTIEQMYQRMNKIQVAIEFISSMNAIVSKYDIKETLSSTFTSHFMVLSPITKALNENLYSSKLDEFQRFDSYFDKQLKYQEKNWNQIQDTMKKLISKHIDLTNDAKKVKQIVKQISDFRKAVSNCGLLVHPIEHTDLNLLKDRMKQHLQMNIVDSCFKSAKMSLIVSLNENKVLLDSLTDEFSLIFYLEATLKEKIVPKFQNCNRYLNGELVNLNLFNEIFVRDDRIIKCICVSKKLNHKRENNIKVLERELKVMNINQPISASLKNVFMIPEIFDGLVSLNYVCFEFDRAPYNLEQYLSKFQNLDISTMNSLAHQLVLCAYSIHSNGVFLLDVRPSSIHVSCNVDGSNPELKLCDFSCCLSNAIDNINVSDMVNYIAPELSNGQNHTFLSDIFLLGRTMAYIFAQDRTDITQLVLSKDCVHSEIIQRCQAQDPHLRPTIYDLNCHEWRTIAPVKQDRLTLIHRQINQFIVGKQALLRDNNQKNNLVYRQTNESFEEFFTIVFSSTNSFIDGTDYLGAFICLKGMKQLSIVQFVDHIFKHRSLPQINTEMPDDLILAMCGFLYCCFVFQISVDESQVGHFLLNAISDDFDKLSDANVIHRVFPNESLAILNIMNSENLNFNYFGGKYKLVTANNIDEFLQFARESASEPWAELSKRVNATFNGYELISQLGVTLTFAEVKTMMCGPPRFTAEQVLATLEFDGSVPTNVREALAEVFQEFDSLEMLQFVYWLNGSPKLNSFTVILHPEDTMLPSVALCDHTLRLPNSVLRVREGIPLAIRGILPNEFKLFITQRLSQWTQDDVDKINNRLYNATLITIEFNNIPGVPSVRVCPNCLTPIEHGGACKSMKCFTCARDFCFSCLSSNCGHFGRCSVAPVQNVTLKQVQERMQQFQ